MSAHNPIVVGVVGVWTIVPVLLGIAAVVVYFVGARPGKPWGVPLLVLLVLGCVAGLLADRLNIGRRIERARLRHRSQRLMGEGLKDDLSDGAKVLIFRRPLPEEMEAGEVLPDHEKVMEKKQRWKEAMEDGAGVTIDIVACVPPQPHGELTLGSLFTEPGDARAFSRVLEKHKDEGIDAWISFIGAPRPVGVEGTRDLHNVTSYDWPNPPKVGIEMNSYYRPNLLREWFEDGLVDAVVDSYHRPDGALVTADTLDEFRAAVSD